MLKKLTTALWAALIIANLTCSAAFAEYKGPLWALGESYVTENTAVKSSSGGLTMEDSKFGYKIECKASDEGKVSPEGGGEITSLSLSACKSVAGCEATGITGTALKTPWKTQLEETEVGAESGIRELKEKISGIDLSFECLVIGIKVKDECSAETTTAAVETVTEGTDLIFGPSSPHLNCSAGGAGSGVPRGTDLDENVAGKHLIAAYYLRLVTNATGTRKEAPNAALKCEFMAVNNNCVVEVQNHSDVRVFIYRKEPKGINASIRYGVPGPTEYCTAGRELAAAPPGGIGGTCSDVVKPLVTPEAGWSNNYTVIARDSPVTGYPTAEALLLTY